MLSIQWMIVILLLMGSEVSFAQSDQERLQTAWGHPDLQGVWDFSSDTPLNRPSEFEGRAFLTEEEAAQRQHRTTQARQEQDSNPARTGSTGTYNRFWTDFPRSSRQTSLVVDPPNGKVPPLTVTARQYLDELEDTRRGVDLDAPTPGGFVEDLGPRGLFVRCITGFNSGPPMVPQSYNQNVQVFQTRDHVVLLNEMVHSARIVSLNPGPALRDGIQQWLGDSRGSWDGDTLVVTTTNFKDIVFEPARIWGGTGSRPGGKKLLLVERFTRITADTLLYQFTVQDADWYSAPWTARLLMAKSDEPIYEFACHEGNYGLENILAGARAQEAADETTLK